jgi:7-cyano-7-deazaguanine reductase
VSDTSKLTVLGGPTAYRYEKPEAGILESFANAHVEKPWVVGLECAEFTSLCPMTGQPDFGRIRIQYVPDQRCVESKSLKLYLGAYRNHGAFHEDCVNRIASDLQSCITARYLRVFGDFNPRGGITIRPLAVRTAPDLEPAEEARCLALLNQYDSITSGPGPSGPGPSGPGSSGPGPAALV